MGADHRSENPPKISFSQVTSHSWSNPAKYEQSKAELEARGFQRSAAFVATPQKWIVEFWLGRESGLFAKSRKRLLVAGFVITASASILVYPIWFAFGRR
jgi:hypothetical protein